MEHKKKYHGGVSILLVLLFSIFLGCYSNCYAYMSSEYLNYGINTLANNIDTGSSTSTMKSILNNLSNNSNSKNLILTNFNNQLDTWGIPNIEDRNILGCGFAYSGNTLRIKLMVFNMGSPR